MTEQTKRGRAQDRAKVAGGQKHETAYEAKKTGTTSGEVRQAVKKVGNSRGRVRPGRVAGAQMLRPGRATPAVL